MLYVRLVAIEDNLKTWKALSSSQRANDDIRFWVDEDDISSLLEEIKRLRKLVGEPYPGMHKTEELKVVENG